MQVKGHAYARGVLTVTYSDDTTESFYGVTDEQHTALIRSGQFDDKGQPVLPTPAQQEELLKSLRSR